MTLFLFCQKYDCIINEPLENTSIVAHRKILEGKKKSPSQGLKLYTKNSICHFRIAM